MLPPGRRHASAAQPGDGVDDGFDTLVVGYTTGQGVAVMMNQDTNAKVAYEVAGAIGSAFGFPPMHETLLLTVVTTLKHTFESLRTIPLLACALLLLPVVVAAPAAAGPSQADGVITSVARGNEGTDLKIVVNGVSTRFWFDNASNFAINGRQPDCQGTNSFGEFTSGKMPDCPGWSPVTIGKTRVRVSYHKTTASGAVVLVADSLTTL